MEKSERDRYAAALHAKQTELVSGLNKRDGLTAEAEPDPFDEIQSALDRALIIETLDRNSLLLREVQAALDRTEDGTYGQCLRCEREISPKRLAAAPWAQFCIKCQEYAEREGRGQPQYVDLLKAA